MYKQSKIWLVLAGACMFNAIFWQEKLGINLLLYDAFIIGTVLFLYPNAKSNVTVRWLLLLQTISLIMVLVHNTLLSKIAAVLTLLAFIGFSQYVHRSIFFAGGSVMMNTVLIWETLLQKRHKIQGPTKTKRLKRFLLLTPVPLLLAGIFFIIYTSSNSVFSNISDRIGSQIERVFQFVFSWFRIDRLLFLALGLYITGWVLVRSSRNFFSTKEALYKDSLERAAKSLLFLKKKFKSNSVAGSSSKPGKNTMALKNEYKIGIASLVLLNGLILAVNMIDIVYVWFHFEFIRDVDLSKVVHEGTGLLIFSIILAMMILLFLFKGNLNFYKENKWLKYLAYTWIIQNCILVISVAIRDYYYIAHYGLSYKRIGVLSFLLSVLAGLVTVLIKIVYRKTNYYLFRINAWINISLLVMATTIQWDGVIAQYNISRADKIRIDWNLLLSLSDKILPLLDQNIHLMESVQQPSPPDDRQYGDINEFDSKARLYERERSFLLQQTNYSWLSWNYSDDYVKSYLLQHAKKRVSKN